MYSLAQNYPDPFNPAASIRYSLATRSAVTLTVYNALGQIVSTHVNDVQDPGPHVVRFDGSALASGVYVYRIHAGSFVQARKFILLNDSGLTGVFPDRPVREVSSSVIEYGTSQSSSVRRIDRFNPTPKKTASRVRSHIASCRAVQ